MSKTRIAVLGTGRMGAVLATTFAGAGHAVTAWNRTAARAAPLAERGVQVAASVVEAVRAADVVVGNLADYVASAAVVRAAGVVDALRGKVFVELATGTPRQAQEAAAWADGAGVRYLDGAIMSVPSFVGTPECTLLYAGPDALFRELAPSLRALGGNTRWVGAPIGHANALDNALLVTLWGATHGALQGAGIVEAAGVPLAEYRAGLDGMLPQLGPMFTDSLERIERRQWAADATTAATLGTCHASVRMVARISEELGLDLSLPRALDRAYQLATDRGDAEDDAAALYRAIRAVDD